MCNERRRHFYVFEKEFYMENTPQEEVLIVSKFDSTACFVIALIFFYLPSFIVGGIIGYTIDIIYSFVYAVLAFVIFGGLAHLILYFIASRSKLILTNYKIKGIYNSCSSVNIPLDSITSVSRGFLNSLLITCPGNVYTIFLVENRNEICRILNMLMNIRAYQQFKSSPMFHDPQLASDDIASLNYLYTTEDKI